MPPRMISTVRVAVADFIASRRDWALGVILSLTVRNDVVFLQADLGCAGVFQNCAEYQPSAEVGLDGVIEFVDLDAEAVRGVGGGRGRQSRLRDRQGRATDRDGECEHGDDELCHGPVLRFEIGVVGQEVYLLRELARVHGGFSGVGALVCNNVTLGTEWVIWMGEFPETGRHSLALLCRTLRTRAAGPTQTLLRGRIEAILEPGQRLVPGRVLAGNRWIEASSTTPVDPLLKTAA